MSAARRGKKINLTPQQREQRRQAMLGNTLSLGVRQSEETKV
jgi:hypothetical protein